MRQSSRLRSLLEEMSAAYPEAQRFSFRVRTNRRPSLGFTWEADEDEVLVHINDILLERSDEEVLRAISHLVLLSVFRDAYSSAKKRLVEAHKRRLESDEGVIREMLGRDRNLDLKLTGRHHDLQARFEEVNREHFGGRVPKLNLAWSTRVERSRWGYADRDRRLIVLNRQLDGPKVPLFVVDYILYHEMLHIVHKGLLSRFGREDHYVDFYRDEKKFPRYEEAERWLKENG